MVGKLESNAETKVVIEVGVELSILSEKNNEVRKCREIWESSIVEYDQEEFEKDLTHAATNTIMLQTKSRLFWPCMC